MVSITFSGSPQALRARLLLLNVADQPDTCTTPAQRNASRGKKFGLDGLRAFVSDVALSAAIHVEKTHLKANGMPYELADDEDVDYGDDDDDAPRQAWNEIGAYEVDGIWSARDVRLPAEALPLLRNWKYTAPSMEMEDAEGAHNTKQP